MQRDKTFAIIQRLPPERTKPYYSKPKWRLQRSKIAKMQKMHFFALLSPKCTFGPEHHFLSILSILEHFCTFLLKMTKNGFTRAYETQAGSVLAKKLSFLRKNAPKCWKWWKWSHFWFLAPKTDSLLFLAFFALGEASCSEHTKPCRLLVLLRARITPNIIWAQICKVAPFS